MEIIFSYTVDYIGHIHLGRGLLFMGNDKFGKAFLDDLKPILKKYEKLGKRIAMGKHCCDEDRIKDVCLEKIDLSSTYGDGLYYCSKCDQITETRHCNHKGGE